MPVQTMTSRQLISRLYLDKLSCGSEDIRAVVHQEMAADLGCKIVETFPECWLVEALPIDGEIHTFSVVVMTQEDYNDLHYKAWRYDDLCS